jgi:septum formation protein
MLITSDTIVWFKEKAIEKPKNKQEAKEMLEELSGKKHQVFTSICISLKNQQKIVNKGTKVYFNILKEEDINYYIKKYDVLDRAGSYGIQDLIGYIGVKKIKGCYNNVLGFPTSLFCETIEKMKL